MKYDGLIFMQQQTYDGQIIIPLHAKAPDALIFHDYDILSSSLTYFVVNIFEDNSINVQKRQYTLTPAT